MMEVVSGEFLEKVVCVGDGVEFGGGIVVISVEV